jgi:hypothetical protein
LKRWPPKNTPIITDIPTSSHSMLFALPFDY